MSDTNRLQAQRPSANTTIFLPAPLKSDGVFEVFIFRGKLYRRGILLIGLGKTRVVTECNIEQRVGCNGASRFGFEFRIVGGIANWERNETAGWPKRNGMKEALLRG